MRSTACDDTVVFKSVVREIARNHGLRATFMAKPFPGVSGNGLHLHHSLRKDGVNVFEHGTDEHAARQRVHAPLGRGADDARRADRAAREPDGQRLQAHRGLLVRAHARELGARQPQRRGALHPAGRARPRASSSAAAPPTPTPTCSPPPCWPPAWTGSSASSSCRRRPSTTPTPTSACRSCRARSVPRSRPGRRRRSRARRSASAFADNYAALARYDLAPLRGLHHRLGNAALPGVRIASVPRAN